VGKHHNKLLNNLESLRKAAQLTQAELSERAWKWDLCALHGLGLENCQDLGLHSGGFVSASLACSPKLSVFFHPSFSMPCPSTASTGWA